MFFRTQHHAKELEAEEREAKRLAHLRESRTARFEKMLDPRCAIGSDTFALDQQSRAKALQQAEARAEKINERENTITMLAELARLEAIEKTSRKATALEVARALDEQKSSQVTRTTWDLEDPLSKKNGEPIRKGIDDPRLGLSSAQVFSGEDVSARQRALLQQAQVRAWTAQMVSEKNAMKIALKAKDEEVAANMVHCAKLAGEIEAAGIAEHKARERASVFQNESLIAAKKKQREKEKEEDMNAGMMTFGTMNTRGAGMGILAEDITDGVSASSPNRFRPEYFRGIPPTSPAGSLQALATLDAQVEAKAAREAREREDKAVQAAQDAAELKHAAQLERSVKEAAAAQRKATAEVLNAQKAAAEEKRRLEREAKRNYRIGEDFYKGFGKAF